MPIPEFMAAMDFTNGVHAGFHHVEFMAADYNDDFDAYAAKSFLELEGDSF